MGPTRDGVVSCALPPRSLQASRLCIENPLPIPAANVHVSGPSSLLLSLVAPTLKRTQAERPRPALSHVGGPTSKMSKLQSYGLVVPLESKQEYAMNANPDFCMKLPCAYPGWYSWLLFLFDDLGSIFHLPTALPAQRDPYCGPCGVLWFLCRYTTHLTWQSVRRVLFYISGRCSALPSFSRL